MRSGDLPGEGSWYARLVHALLGGLTWERLAVVLVVCAIVSSARVTMVLAQGNFEKAAWLFLDRGSRTFFFALPLLTIVVVTEQLSARWPTRRRVIALTLAVLAGAICYSAIRTGRRMSIGDAPDPSVLWHASLAYFAYSLVLGGTLTAILYYAARERETAQRLHRARLERIEIERQLAESNLHLLRVQIEPHFLFNSLATVKRLYEGDPREGRALLADLANYLRAATASADSREVPLGDEIAQARSFLGICQLRMGRRLNVRIDVPAHHELALVPPMAIGTLVENAIKHGLGPRGGGGTLTLSARRDGEALVINVGDDGVGFRARSGRGVGLSNTRSRLSTLFGDSASLDLAANPDGGVTATLRVPYRVAA